MKRMTMTLGVLLWLPAEVLAAEAPEPVPAPQPAAVVVPPAAEAPYQVLLEARQRVRWLDPAVFTDISPLTVPENGIRLPEDQQE